MKRATLGTIAALNEPRSNTFENHRADLENIRAAFGIGLGNIDSSHTRSNIFVLVSATFYKKMAHRYPFEIKSSHPFHIIAVYVDNFLHSIAVSLSGEKGVSTKESQMVRHSVAKSRAVDGKCS